MSAFASNFRAAYDAAMLPLAGVAITYTPRATGVASEAFYARSRPVMDKTTKKVITSRRTLIISPTDVEEPLAGDTGTVEGRSFRVVEVLQTDGGVWDCLVDLGAPA